MPIRNVNLTDHFDSFVESGISSGRFSDANEAVREELRLLEERETARDIEDQAELEWLRSAAQDSFAALDRGEGIPFHSIDGLATFINETAEGLAARPRVSPAVRIPRLSRSAFS